MKSIREIVEEIAEGVSNSEHHNAKLARRIEQALRDRDDRAAKIADRIVADNARIGISTYAKQRAIGAREVAAAIRK